MTIIEPQALHLSGLISKTDQAQIALLGVKIQGEIKGLLCDWRITQRYRNSESKPIEAIYLFPLPEDSTVSGLTVTIGKRVLRAEIEEREAAFEKYDQAMEDGDGAFLLDQERPNVFQMSVGNLLPKEEAVIEVRFLNLAKPSGNSYRFMLPTTISPRYTPGSATAEEKAEVDRISPDYSPDVPYGLSLSIDVAMSSKIKTIESPSHPLRSEVNGKKAKIEFGQTETAMDRDVVILIETAKPREPAVFSGRWKDRDYMLLELYPEITEGKPEPKSVAFLVDCSGSMEGSSIDQAKKALELCLRGLNIGDKFQIIRFGTKWEKLFPEPLTFDQSTLEKVIPMVSNIHANLGGTEILGALQGVSENFKEGLLDLIVLTDGKVSNENDVLLWAEKNKGRIRVFSFGIGAGASEFLISGLARKSAGAAEFIFPGERIESKVLKQFGRISTPALKDLKISWGDSAVSQAPEEIPPVFANCAFMVSARLPEKARIEKGCEVTLSGKAGSKKVEWTVAAESCSEGEALSLWWARQAIRDLEEHPDKLQRGSNQNRKRGESRIVKLSKEFGILSSETSFVAIEERAEEKKSTERAELRKVPIMITTGWHGGRASSPMPMLLQRSMVCPGAPAPTAASFGGAVGRVLGGLAGSVANVFSEIKGKTAMKKARQERGNEFYRKNLSVDLCKPLPSSLNDSAGRSDSDWVIDLLSEMQAEGYFRLNPIFEKVSGKALKTLSNWAMKIEVTKYSEKDHVLATVLAIILLRTKASNEEDTWSLAATKAARWLEDIEAKGESGTDLFKWLETLLEKP